METLIVHWNVDPAIFRLGGFELRWYSLLFVGGFILGWFIMKSFFQREKISEALLDPMLYMLLICTIVGARLGHCIFYQPDYYFGSWAGFWEIFMPWKGGLASHGGTIALLLGIWWYANKYGPKNGFDYVYGGPTSLPWGFVFERNGETAACHPTQLYEAGTYLLEGLLLMGLYWKRLDKTYRGSFVGLFLIICFGSRFLIEFIKNPQVEFEQGMALNMGQLLSIPFVLLGIGFLVYAFVKKQPARAVHPESAPKKKEETHFARPTGR